jgi:AraC family transcriptional regulator, arabinose operon regulatory protein
MFKVPKEYFKNDTVHRSISTDPKNGILSCGFLNKSTTSDINVVFEYYGALLVLSGEGMHVDSDGCESRLYPGCFVQRIPQKLHSTYVHPDGNWLEFFICFGKDIFLALSNINVLNNKQDVLYPGVNPVIFREFTDFMNELKNAPEENLPLLLIKAQKIILDIYQMHHKGETNDENREVIRQACLLLGQNPPVQSSVHDICRELGIGYESFRKLFKNQVGISPCNYMISSRINRAKSLLIESNKSIKEIAADLGFSDSFSFSKQFKMYVGKSPRSFRSSF